MEKEKLLVSACFLFQGYKYDGTANINQRIIELQEKYEFIYICPEVFGGLSVPRYPSEIVGEKVMNVVGEDVTNAFNLGAKKALELAKKHGCKKALLKAKSPSCGKGKIYDGTFSHQVVDGNGVAVRLLMENGIEIYTENELEKL